MNDWIKWDGGECPVQADTMVEVRFRCGETGQNFANEWCWSNIDTLYDIDAYRVVSETPSAPPSALSHQEGGDHYKKLAIQPVEYIYKNNIGYFEGNVIKYVTRWRDKNGVADLKKAKHYIDLLIEMEGEA